MRNVFLILLIAIVSCEGEKNKIGWLITPYVSATIGKENKINLIDVYKIDSATVADQLKYQLENLDASVGHKGDINKINMEALERVKNYYAQTGSAHFANEVAVKQKQYDDYYNAEIKPIVDEMNRLDSLYNHSDTTKFLAYKAKAILKYTTPEKVQKSDTILVIINKEKNKVIEKNDFWQNKF